MLQASQRSIISTDRDTDIKVLFFCWLKAAGSEGWHIRPLQKHIKGLSWNKHERTHTNTYLIGMLTPVRICSLTFDFTGVYLLAKIYCSVKAAPLKTVIRRKERESVSA